MNDFRYIDVKSSKIPDCEVHTLIPGDIHLGSKSSRIEPLIEIVSYYQKRGLKRIIFQGDTFEHNRLSCLPKPHQAFLDFVRQSNLETIWLSGNHDSKLPELLAKFFSKDIAVHQESRFVHENFIFGVVHGDSFDPAMKTRGLTGKAWSQAVELGTYIHNQAQRIDDQFAAWLKHQFKGPLLNTIKHVKKGGLRYAHENNLDVIFCGHTHEPASIHQTKKGKKVTYINVSCFTEKICGAGLITKSGFEIVHLTTFKKPILV